jgi:anti-sigma28 factor (negative regulator of flagellin synthesis)
MKIDSKAQSGLQALAARALRDRTPTGGMKAVVPAPADASARGDSVELSHAARQLSQGPSLTQERIQEVRQRIAAGTYDAPAVADAVARGILASGDL